MMYCALPGVQMVPTDALSHQDDVDITQDNIDVQLLPPDALTNNYKLLT